MPRSYHFTEPQIINSLKSVNSSSKIIEVATRNENKLNEFRRIIVNYEIIGKDLKIEEIQDLDPLKVVKFKAKEAWKANEYNPILVEDTSLEIMGLGGRPGVYVNDFCSEIEMRRMIAETWLKDKDRRALARVILCIYDGKEFHIREGKVDGEISSQLKGTNGFGWDDMFIPAGSDKTFAEMNEKQKDKYSMRKFALEKLKTKPFEITNSILMVNEPYEQEIERMRLNELKDSKALKFAYSLECLDENKLNNDFRADKYSQIEVETNKFFSRFIKNTKSKSLGILLTDIDRSFIKQYKNGDPIIWQMGPDRRHLALAQRAEFFLQNINKEVQNELKRLDKTEILPRSNNRSSTIETALGTNRVGNITQTKALKEIGYKKISSSKYVSRTDISFKGLFNKVGKYNRSIFGIGSMPPISGWRDVLVTSAIGHMPVFTHRNSLNALDFQNQIDLINSARKTIKSLKLSKPEEERAQRNIGSAIGCGNVKEEIKNAKKLFKEADVKLFRIYTINGDPRVIEMAREMRKEFGDEIEIFVGQVTDKDQALELIAQDIMVDGLVFGHGGGMQCTSATNGMALTTLEEIYAVITDPRFNKVSVVAEGGVGRSVGALLVAGVDLILCNQKLVHGTIELSDIFFEHKNGKLCQPYHGSASAPTMIIESLNKDLAKNRLYASGRAKKIEGRPGYMFLEKKVNTMAFYIVEFKHYAARTLADLGVSNMQELRKFLRENHKELFRIISTEANLMGNPHSVT